jgi:hypothetical protein
MTATKIRHTSWWHRAVLAAAIAAVGLACTATTHADAAPVDVQVVDRESGQPLQVWRHDGHLFVAGTPGDRYGLRVTNHTDGRVLVVMSVDGVNIITGETAGYNQRGYIFAPHESYELDGWRKTLTEVADFTFARLPQSYAALTGRPANVGVIGIAVFNERMPPVVAETLAPQAERGPVDRAAAAERAASAARFAHRGAPEPTPPPAAGKSEEVTVTAQKRESRLASVPLAVSGFTSRSRDAVAAEPRDEKLGTGHGPREWSVTTEVAFERATPRPQFTQEIAYDTRDNLVAMGVIPPWRYGERQPRPFPSSPDASGFVPDPPDDR